MIFNLIKLLKKFLLNFIKLSCFLNFPLLTSLLIFFFIKKNNNIKLKKKTNGKILYLYRSIGVSDLELSFQKIKSDNIIYNCNREYFVSIFKYFVSNKLDDFNYNLVGTNIDKKKYRDYLIRVLFYLKKCFNFVGIINSSAYYTAEREIERATEFLSIPFITIHKEGFKPPKRRIITEWFMKNKIPRYRGSKLIVYNDDEKKSFSISSFCEREKIEVCGCPRFDKYLKIKKKKQKKKTISFFLIQLNYGIPIKDNKWFVPKPLKKKINLEKFDWRKINKIYVKFIQNFIKQNPNHHVIIKAKSAFAKSQLELLDIQNYKNVEIITSGDSFDIVKKSDFIVAFNTSVMIETIGAKKPLFSMRKLIRNKKQLGCTLETFDMDKSIKEILKINDIEIKPYDKNKRYKLIKKYMGFVDGKSSIRVGKSINQHIKEFVNL